MSADREADQPMYEIADEKPSIGALIDAGVIQAHHADDLVRELAVARLRRMRPEELVSLGVLTDGDLAVFAALWGGPVATGDASDLGSDPGSVHATREDHDRLVWRFAGDDPADGPPVEPTAFELLLELGHRLGVRRPSIPKDGRVLHLVARRWHEPSPLVGEALTVGLAGLVTWLLLRRAAR